MSPTSDLSPHAMAQDAARVVRVLCLRLERDYNALLDCASVQEQERFMNLVCDAVRINLMIDGRWSNENAHRVANEYREVLKFRLARPEFFRKRTGDA